MYSPTLSPISHDDDLVNQAAELLRRPTALSELQPEEALCIVSYMRLIHCAEGSVLMREGDTDNSDHMLLIIDGEVSVETTVASRTDPLIVTVLGPGSLVGEMGLLDGAPRAASCVALSPIVAAGLSRRALRAMMVDDPSLAAKLLVGVSQRLAERLRESGRQQRVFSQLVRAMQGEIDELNHQLHTVMEGAVRRQSEG
jgi:CRP/FNR family cyclic AMP-dependent transcriptional regulator